MTRAAVTRRSLAAVAVTPLLAACGQAGQQATTTEAQPAKVQFYFGTAGAPEIQLYTTLKEGFEKQFPKYTIELIPAENETEKALTMMSAGTPPDIYWNRVRASQVFIRRDALVDLLPLMKRDKLSQDDFWPSAIRAYTYKGGFFGLPTSASSNALYFNKIHFRAVGLPLPNDLEKQGKWNWDALVDTARKLTRTEAGGKKIWGFSRPSGLTLTVQYIWQNGGTPFSEDRTQSLITSAEVMGAEQWLADLVLKHQVSAPPGDPADGDNPFRTDGIVAMQQSGRFAMPGIVQGTQAGTIDPGMVVAPKGPKKDTTRGDDLASSILKTSKVVEAAWAFSKYWASEEGQLVVLKSNRSYTSRRSIAKNPSILKQVLNPWEDGDAYYTGLQRGEVFPVTPKFVPQVRDTFDREEKLAHAGTKTVRDAMQTAHTEISPMLKEPF